MFIFILPTMTFLKERIPIPLGIVKGLLTTENVVNKYSLSY